MPSASHFKWAGKNCSPSFFQMINSDGASAGRVAGCCASATLISHLPFLQRIPSPIVAWYERAMRHREQLQGSGEGA